MRKLLNTWVSITNAMYTKCVCNWFLELSYEYNNCTYIILVCLRNNAVTKAEAELCCICIPLEVGLKNLLGITSNFYTHKSNTKAIYFVVENIVNFVERTYFSTVKTDSLVVEFLSLF